MGGLKYSVFCFLPTFNSLKYFVTQARKVARDLGLSQARVVLLIVSPDNVRILIGQAYELGLLRTHVWLVIELWEQWINGVNHLDERFIGTLFLRPSTPQPSYSVLDYMNNATIKMKVYVCVCVSVCVCARAYVRVCVCVCVCVGALLFPILYVSLHCQRSEWATV